MPKTPSRTGKVNQISRGVLKTVAGMMVTSPKDFIKLAAHSGDQMLKGHFSAALVDSYCFFLNNAEIDPEYFDSEGFADLAPEFQRVNNEPYGVDKLNSLRKRSIMSSFESFPFSGSFNAFKLVRSMTKRPYCRAPFSGISRNGVTSSVGAFMNTRL